MSYRQNVRNYLAGLTTGEIMNEWRSQQAQASKSTDPADHRRLRYIREYLCEVLEEHEDPLLNKEK